MCCPIQFVIILMINKSDSPCVVIWFMLSPVWWITDLSGLHSVLLPLLVIIIIIIIIIIIWCQRLITVIVDLDLMNPWYNESISQSLDNYLLNQGFTLSFACYMFCMLHVLHVACPKDCQYFSHTCINKNHVKPITPSLTFILMIQLYKKHLGYRKQEFKILWITKTLKFIPEQTFMNNCNSQGGWVNRFDNRGQQQEQLPDELYPSPRQLVLC